MCLKTLIAIWTVKLVYLAVNHEQKSHPETLSLLAMGGKIFCPDLHTDVFKSLFEASANQVIKFWIYCLFSTKFSHFLLLSFNCSSEKTKVWGITASWEDIPWFVLDTNLGYSFVKTLDYVTCHLQSKCIRRGPLKGQYEQEESPQQVKPVCFKTLECLWNCRVGPASSPVSKGFDDLLQLFQYNKMVYWHAAHSHILHREWEVVGAQPSLSIVLFCFVLSINNIQYSDRSINVLFFVLWCFKCLEMSWCHKDYCASSDSHVIKEQTEWCVFVTIFFFLATELESSMGFPRRSWMQHETGEVVTGVSGLSRACAHSTTVLCRCRAAPPSTVFISREVIRLNQSHYL